MKTLEQRVQALEDTQAIINLKSDYLDAANGGWDRKSHNGPRIAAQFAEDATWEIVGIIAVKGNKTIGETLSRFEPGAPFALHLVSNPFIEVDGDRAIGNWYLLAMNTTKDGGDILTTVVYKDTFVRKNGRWLFQSLHASIIFQGPIREKSWAELVKAAGVPDPTQLLNKK